MKISEVRKTESMQITKRYCFTVKKLFIMNNSEENPVIKRSSIYF